MVHGIGGHGGLFARFAVELAELGYTVHAPDLPGHGRCTGPRGWVESWSLLRESLRRSVEQVTDAAAPLPLFLYGHSLGGTAVLDLLLHEPPPLAGVVLSNPALDPGGVALWRRTVARVLSRIHPTFSLRTGIPLQISCRDPARQEEYAADPLRHDLCTARLGAEFILTATAIRRQAHRLTLPLLLLQSGADPVTPPQNARAFFEALGSRDKTWKLYPDSFHELHDDLDRGQVLADLAQWLDDHVG
jgi:alpha-beta hydrolase superfamily lysophospholipase